MSLTVIREYPTASSQEFPAPEQ